MNKNEFGLKQKQRIFFLSIILSSVLIFNIGLTMYNIITSRGIRNDYYRIYDRDARVVCWSRNGYPHAWSCLPISQTNLKEPSLKTK